MRDRCPLSQWMGLALALAVDCSPTPAVVGDDGWNATERVRAPSTSAGALPAAPRATLIAPPQRRPWRFARQLDALTPLPGRGPSEHGRGLERTTAVNAAAASYGALSSRRPLPPGAMVVQRHLHEGTEQLASYYIMRKLSRPGPTGAWSYTVLDPQRRVAAREPLELCARCHREAPFDDLFGPVPVAAPAPAGSPPATP